MVIYAIDCFCSILLFASVNPAGERQWFFVITRLREKLPLRITQLERETSRQDGQWPILLVYAMPWPILLVYAIPKLCLDVLFCGFCFYVFDHDVHKRLIEWDCVTVIQTCYTKANFTIGKLGASYHAQTFYDHTA